MGGAVPVPTIIKEGEEMNESRNNGGSTGYYDLLKPKEVDIFLILEAVSLHKLPITEAIEEIYTLFPKTLNDLIEHKNMQPWQHEVFKACYALDERAAKATDGSSSRLREINKMEYYIGRGKDLELNKSK